MINSNKGFFYVICAAFFFSTQAIAGKYILRSGIEPMELACIQFGIITIIMLGVVILRRDKTVWMEGIRHWKGLLLFASLGSAATSTFLYMSLMTLNAGIGSMLLFTHPVFVCIFFIITGIRKISWVNKASLIAAIVGSAMTLNVFQSGLDKEMLVGVLFGILSSICYAFYNIYYDLKLSTLNTSTALLFGSGFATLTMILFHPSIFYDFPKLNIGEFGLIAMIAIVAGILPAYLLYKGIRAIGSNKATIISTAELPFTLLIAFLILGETLIPIQIIGVFLIIVAVLALQNEEKIKNKILGGHYIFGWENDNDLGLELIDKILTGKKTATCSFKEYYERTGEKSPYSRLGKTVKVIDKNGKLRCQVIVTDVFETPVKNPSMTLVQGEGFGNDQKSFIDDCKLMWEADMPGIPFNENATLIAEIFSLVE